MTFDWSIYKGNLKWLQERTIYVTRHGSHAYGTTVPTSDLDIRGIAIAPKDYYLGCNKNFEQAEMKDPDFVVFELRKFLKLASDCNPNALELIFTDPEDHLVQTPLGSVLVENRNMFLTKRVKFTFQGYAHSQMKRIRLHRQYLLHPVHKPPTREEFKLPERTVIPADQLAAAKAAIKKRLDEWNWHEFENVEPSMRLALQDEFCRRLTEITAWSWEETPQKMFEAAAHTLGYDTNFIEFLDKERQYTSKMREWQQYQEWKKNRNPLRADMEAQFGYDLKHALHLVRLSRTCKELLIEGVLRVRRPDAAELLSIRSGAWTYDHLVEWFAQQEIEIEEAAKTSTLPHSPDRNKIDKLCQEMVEASW
jgi:predicted nucleotidyltransferase